MAEIKNKIEELTKQYKYYSTYLKRLTLGANKYKLSNIILNFKNNKELMDDKHIHSFKKDMDLTYNFADKELVEFVHKSIVSYYTNKISKISKQFNKLNNGVPISENE